MRARTALVAGVIAAALLGAGCGGGGGGTSSPISSPSVDSAVNKCLEQAKTVQSADARKTAEEACKSAKSGNTSKVKSAVKQECLNAVQQIPNSAKSQKAAARARCNAIK